MKGLSKAYLIAATMAIAGAALVAAGIELSACSTCGPASCSGCCDATGACQESASAHCGKNGNACSTCLGFQQCQVGVCIIAGGGGGGDSGTGSTSGSTGTSGTGSTTGTTGGQICGTLYGPTSPTSACSCPASHQADCQPNGCYGGWWCDVSSGRCQSPPAGCGTTGTSGTTGTTSTSGTTGSGWTGSVGNNGGTVSRLYFAVVGDTRPPNLDDTSGYPSQIIQTIYQDMASLNPAPEFAVATGDYMYASPSGSAGSAQLALYLQARQAFSGVLFPAMGNHECTGYTASNCGPGTSNTTSNNYDAFMQQLIAPIGQSTPYYRIDVNDSAGQWTAKLVVIAANAWTQTQANWLSQQMAQPTTYTFVIRHEPEIDNTAPGVTPSDNIIGQYPYTLKLVGHTHEFYAVPGGKQVIVGNGGAPISGSSPYGYALVQQTASGDIQISEMDYNSNAALSTVVVPK